MKSLLARLGEWWESLAEKDKKTLKIASPVIVVLLVYLLLIQPVTGHYFATKSHRVELSESLVWLYENTALVERMTNQCTRVQLFENTGDDLPAFIQSIGRRSGATFNVRVINNTEFELNQVQMTGLRAMSLVQSYVCHGFGVSNLKIQRDSPDASQVEFSVRLKASQVIQSGNL